MDDSSPPENNRSPASPGAITEWAKIAVIPLVIGVTGYLFTSWQKERDDAENNVRLYTQLVTQREQSDTQLRTEMFKAVLEKFLSGGNGRNPPDMVLKLELLAYNFHESLDLGPLFKEVLRRLDAAHDIPRAERNGLRKRLDAAAGQIVFQQVATLSLKGQRWTKDVSPKDIAEASGVSYVIDEELSEERTIERGQVPPTAVGAESEARHGTGMRLRLEVLSMDVKRREVEVRLLLQRRGAAAQVVDRHFVVSRYDFPMLDNTRLPNGERCAVALTDFFVQDKGSEEDKRSNSFANLQVIVFPATSASLKERIEYDELLGNMLRKRTSRPASR